ncbi:uncharacterized protein BHQ10_001921 [Talaromyces amestolkiae]|uniref:Xylanolytic transcriptional activator regulatory domain-containing protein n=1 Tax=Talaromyces amestolkiae TaxID=1196081 RepID=A0A364KQT6_TALAM|nr:uncharacterized protein BHQ10_001921 [Talaromyces amestolkiae]RAO65909.1 hypothetical protein BHQ10_001921 [Talaromyces amestolkiae]
MKKRRTQDQSASGPSITNVDIIESTAVVTPRHFESGTTPSLSTGTPRQPSGLLSSLQTTSRPVARRSPAITPPPTRPKDTLPELCIDRILKGDYEPPTYIQQSIFITSNAHVASSTQAFFSERKIKVLSDILGHNLLGPLIKGLDDATSAKLKGFSRMADKPLAAGSPLTKANITEEDILHAKVYVESFFQYVHPMYPFLDRDEFEKATSRTDLEDFLSRNVMWQALYYAILGLGSMYHNGGSFLPGEGLSWKFFQAALNLMPELLLIRRTIETAQALIAMAIFAQVHASLPVDEIPVNEAARITISLGLGKRPKAPSSFQNRSKAFWVVYCMEKDFAFNVGRSSLINDCDIACPLPSHVDPVLGELDWIRAWASFSRLTSKAYDLLFSISATLSEQDTYFRHTDSILADLDAWKEALPQQFRPGSAIKLHLFNGSVSLTLAIRIHFYYYNLQIAIARLILHLSDGEHTARQSQSKLMLMHAARSIVSLTNFLAIEPFTPCWMLIQMPMVAVFILFELVIHNPVHRETTNNLIYLDLASGYFARMQMTQGADRDLSISMTQLIQLARDFVQQSRQTYTHAEEPEHQVETISTISSYSNLHGSHGSETRHIAHTPQEAQQTDLNTSINPLNFRQSTDFPIDGAVSIPKLYGKKEGY